jgi:hypothetical protein
MNRSENNKDIKKNQVGNENSAKPVTSVPAPGFRTTTEAIFEPFSWLPRSMRGAPHAEFIARTRDVCMGVRTCIQIVHSDGMDRDAGQETLLSMSQTEYLFMLAVQAVAMLAEEADREIEFMHDRASKSEVQS